MNAKGGLAGRKIVVDFIDSKLSADEARNAVIKACSEDFAIVGTSAIFLNNVDDIEACEDKAGAATGHPRPRRRHDRGRAAVLADDVRGQPAAARSARRRTSTRRPTRPTSGARSTTRRSTARTSTAATSPRATSSRPRTRNLGSMTRDAARRPGIKADFTTPIVGAPRPQSGVHAGRPAAEGQVVELRAERRRRSTRRCCCAGRRSSRASHRRLEGLGLHAAVLRQAAPQAGRRRRRRPVRLDALPAVRGGEATTRRSPTSSSTPARSKADGFGVQAYASGLLVSQVVNTIVEDRPA